MNWVLDSPLQRELLIIYCVFFSCSLFIDFWKVVFEFQCENFVVYQHIHLSWLYVSNGSSKTFQFFLSSVVSVLKVFFLSSH
jgi:hypothetical protein